MTAATGVALWAMFIMICGALFNMGAVEITGGLMLISAVLLDLGDTLRHRKPAVVNVYVGSRPQDAELLAALNRATEAHTICTEALNCATASMDEYNAAFDSESMGDDSGDETQPCFHVGSVNDAGICQTCGACLTIVPPLARAPWHHSLCHMEDGWGTTCTRCGYQWDRRETPRHTIERLYCPYPPGRTAAEYKSDNLDAPRD